MCCGLQQLKRNNFRHAGARRFRIKTTQSGHLCSPKRKGRNGTSKNCRRRFLDTAEEDYQEDARKRKVGKKEKKAKKANKGSRNMRKSKKESEALRGWHSKDKTPYKGGMARRLRMKKKKVDKKATKWRDNGKRSNVGMI